MSVSASGPIDSAALTARRKNALSVLFLVLAAGAFLLRFTISPQLLDLVIHYTGEDGAFYEKLHVGTYAVFLLFPLVLFSQKVTLAGDEIGKFRALLRFSAIMVALILYLVVSGHLGTSVFLIDSYLSAGVAGMMMLMFNSSVRRALGDVVLIMLIVSAIIGLGEELTHMRLLPYPYEELQFRPIGLSEHPLALGALCATAIGFVALTHWRLWVRIAAIGVLVIGCAASGARFALLVAAAEVIVLLLFVPWPQLSRRDERKAKFAVLLAVLLTGAVLVALMFAAGLLSRFGTTIFDENFMARISIYEVFGLVDWKDIVFGMKASDLLTLVNQQLHLPTIESTPVVLIMLLGLPFAIFFIVVVFWLLFRLLRGARLAAWIGTIAFLTASLSNNTLSAKTPVIMMMLVLILAYAPQVPSRPKPVAR